MNEATTLTDEQMMLLMAHVDGEVTAEQLEEVERLLRENVDAKAWLEGFNASKEAVFANVMIEAEEVDLTALTKQTAAQTEALQVMADVDGELSASQRAAAGIEQLLSTSQAARGWAHDLKIAKQALHHEIMQPDTAVDMSMLRGRVMRKLPVERQEQSPSTAVGLFPALSAWLSDLGFGKTVLAGGVLAAVLLLAIGVNQIDAPPVTDSSGGPVMSKAGAVSPAPVAQPADGEPEVIIEEMESDGGTVIFEGGEKPGEAVIIWHIDPTEEGAG